MIIKFIESVLFISLTVLSLSFGTNITPTISAEEIVVQKELAATSQSCPLDMEEVSGSFCPTVQHKCIKGGKNRKFEKDGQQMPYYCDEYQKGFAKCEGNPQPKHFCIDKYEYPGKMQIPTVMVSWYKAKELCEAKGKRLCGNDEWITACEGPEHLPYPYGWERDSTKCNIDHTWMAYNEQKLASNNPTVWGPEVDRLSKRVPSGSMPGCVSPYGIYDMTGNVDEWTVNITEKNRKFMSRFQGGHWAKGARNRCRPATTSHDEKFAFYCEGFRCCKDI